MALSRRRFITTTGTALMSASVIHTLHARSKGSEPNPFHLLQLPAVENITIAGELQPRMQRLLQRLHKPLYQYDAIVTCQTHSECPGDWYGRTLLALVQLSRGLNSESAAVQVLLKRLPEQMNKEGYFGATVADIHYDETKVASHNFLLRGLCSAYEWTHNQTLLDLADSIVRRLFLPLRQAIPTYPDHIQRQHLVTGDVLIGMQAGSVGRWRLCTDTGVLFFSLDGLTHVLSLTQNKKLRDLVEIMIARFAQLDLLQIKAQTHATLTTVRALLRMYRLYGDPHYLTLARQRYDLYRAHAWTEDMQNYNWFQRPQWTEGCAIIDSFMAALSLWQETAEAQYLHDAHLIYYTAMRHNQWPNGGYGTTNCLGAENTYHLKHGDEATWCCTMRGGEGLATAVQYTCLFDDRHIVIPFYCDNRMQLVFPDGALHMQQTTRYPQHGECTIQVTSASLQQPKTVWLFIPFLNKADHAILNVNGHQVAGEFQHSFLRFSHYFKTGDTIRLTFPITLRIEKPLTTSRSNEYSRFFHGPMMLGHRGRDLVTVKQVSELREIRDGQYQDATSGIALRALDYDSFSSMAEAKAEPVQFLFPAG
jgi:hypothetical protein